LSLSSRHAHVLSETTEGQPGIFNEESFGPSVQPHSRAPHPLDVWEKTCSYQSINGGGNLFTHRLKNRAAWGGKTPRISGRTFLFVKHDGSSYLVEEASTVERLDLVLLMGFCHRDRLLLRHRTVTGWSLGQQVKPQKVSIPHSGWSRQWKGASAGVRRSAVIGQPYWYVLYFLIGKRGVITAT
jgi:hypothetical protein